MREALDLLLQGAWLVWLLALLLFLAIGSFLNVVIYRVPAQVHWSIDDPVTRGPYPAGIIWPGSHCPKCRHPLSWRDNLPILSYLLLRGCCRYCGASISARYPLVETLCAALSIAVVYQLGFHWATVLALVLTWFLLALTFIDLEHFLLPDKLTFPLIALGLTVNTFGMFTTPSSALIGMVAGYLSLWIVFHGFRLVTGKEGLGYGDFKLVAAIGAWVGWQLLPMVVLLGAGAGALIGITFVVLKRHERSEPIPFGPFLAGGGWLALLWGSEIQAWYFSLLGV